MKLAHARYIHEHDEYIHEHETVFHDYFTDFIRKALARPGDPAREFPSRPRHTEGRRVQFRHPRVRDPDSLRAVLLRLNHTERYVVGLYRHTCISSSDIRLLLWVK